MIYSVARGFHVTKEMTKQKQPWLIDEFFLKRENVIIVLYPDISL